MKSLHCLILMACVCLSACNSKPDSAAQAASSETPTTPADSNPVKETATLNYDELSRIDSALVPNTISDTNQAMLITKSMALMIVPDDMHIQQQMHADSEGYNSLVDDFSYYTAQANGVLKDHQIPLESYSHEKRYMVFKGKPGVVYTVDGNLLANSWGMMLFNGIDTPLLWFGTDITTSVKALFKK